MGAAWAPRGYIWEGGWIGIGRASGVVPPHAHHAVQISISLDAGLRVREADGPWLDAGGAIVLPDVRHSFDACDGLVTMLFIDPECREGRWLGNSHAGPIDVIPATLYAPFQTRLRAVAERPPGMEEITALVRALVRALCIGPPPVRRIDERVRRAIEMIRRSHASRIPLEDVAASVFLSPSRFAHLFSETVGLPFRRYVLWRKLTRAMQFVGRGDTLSAAAHASGFSDSAHLTRTFQQMFGLAPSTMLSRGELYEIPAPFDMTDDVPRG
jgi:AraC-like DNA-binding protein